MRVYFDKQVISYLFKQKEPKYVDLYEKLLKSKNYITFCYSQAHIEDLRNDKSDIKFDELNFMKELVDDNYICYNAIDKSTLPYLAFPIEAFSEHENIFDHITSLNQLFEGLETEKYNNVQNTFIKSAKDYLKETKLDFSFINLNDIPIEHRGVFENVLPFLGKALSFDDFFILAHNGMNSLLNNNNIYRGLRSSIDLNSKNEKFILDYKDIDFNETFLSSQLQKTFSDFVNSIFSNRDQNEVSNYDFFTTSYVSLDLLGISKDKKVKFRNLVNDSLHSYYGAYCDILVSDDEGFLKKTKVLYKLLGIQTQVLDLKEFLKTCNYRIGELEKNSEVFLKLLLNDVNNSLVITEKKSLRYDRTTKTVKSLHNYLGHFNNVDIINHEGDNYIYLYRECANYSNFIMYREIEKIVNNAVLIFGIDDNLQREFAFSNEIKDIEKNVWQGRTWTNKNYILHIEINLGDNRIGLVIKIL